MHNSSWEHAKYAMNHADGEMSTALTYWSTTQGYAVEVASTWIIPLLRNAINIYFSLVITKMCFVCMYAVIKNMARSCYIAD
jgi:hypothetical protein